MATWSSAKFERILADTVASAALSRIWDGDCGTRLVTLSRWSSNPTSRACLRRRTCCLPQSSLRLSSGDRPPRSARRRPGLRARRHGAGRPPIRSHASSSNHVEPGSGRSCLPPARFRWAAGSRVPGVSGVRGILIIAGGQCGGTDARRDTHDPLAWRDALPSFTLTPVTPMQLLSTRKPASRRAGAHAHGVRALLNIIDPHRKVALSKDIAAGGVKQTDWKLGLDLKARASRAGPVTPGWADGPRRKTRRGVPGRVTRGPSMVRKPQPRKDATMGAPRSPFD